MIKANQAMKILLHQYGIEIDKLPINGGYPIWRKYDQAGRPYWGVSHFWYLDENGVSAEQDLSQLEWDGNEVHLDTESKTGIANILMDAIGIMKAWKHELEHNYPDTPFCILASYDNGENLVNKEDFPEGFYSITFRFWAPRGLAAIVDIDCFDDWDQPTLLETCNQCT